MAYSLGNFELINLRLLQLHYQTFALHIKWYNLWWRVHSLHCWFYWTPFSL